MDIMGKLRAYKPVLLAIPPIAIITGLIFSDIQKASSEKTTYHEVSNYAENSDSTLSKLEHSVKALNSVAKNLPPTRTEYSFGVGKKPEEIQVIETSYENNPINLRYGKSFFSIWMEHETVSMYFYDVGSDGSLETMIVTRGKTKLPMQHIDHIGANEISIIDEIKENLYLKQFETFWKDPFLERTVYRRDENNKFSWTRPSVPIRSRDSKNNPQNAYLKAMSFAHKGLKEERTK